MESGSKDQSIPWTKCKWQSAQHKHAGHSQEVARAVCLIRLLLSLFLCKLKEENEQKKGRDLYFTGPHAWMAFKLVLQALQRRESGSMKSPKKCKKTEAGRSEKGIKKIVSDD